MNKHRILLIILLALIAACQSPTAPQPIYQPLTLSLPADQVSVIIYNHGTRNPRKKENCQAPYNRVPAALQQLQSERLMIYPLCSVATEGTGSEHAGQQVYRRMQEIEQTIDRLRAQGIKPQNIFLSGHSKGAWASLMLMDQAKENFNAAILFAPAVANRRGIKTHPWWQKQVRPRQIQQMLSVKRIDALIFAYDNDPYERPEDLTFLTDHSPQTVEIIAYQCQHRSPHNTHLNDCRQNQTTDKISDYIAQQKRIWHL